MKAVLLACLFGLTAQVSAQGLGAGTSGFMNVNSMKGLCSSDNKEEPYYKEGNCLTLSEALSKDKCTAPLLEKLRLKLLRDVEGQPTPEDEKNPFDMIGLSCSSRQGGAGINDPKVLKNPAVFQNIMMQFFMAVAIAESNLDTYFNLEKGPGQNKNVNKKGGMMNLTLKEMDDPKYNKDGCGCKVTNSSMQTAWFWSWFFGPAAYAEGFLAGRSPGPKDSHHSLQCGAYMALVEAERDGTLFGGHRPQSGQPASPDNKPKGAAKIFKSLQSWGTETSSTNGEYLEKNPKLRFIKKKIENYCIRNLKENGSLTRAFDDDFDGQTLRRGF